MQKDFNSFLLQNMNGLVINIITILIFLALGYLFIILKGKSLPKQITNIIFAILISVPYFVMLYLIYDIVGFSENIFLYSTPLGNVSPLMFTLTLIFVFLPKKISKTFFTLLSLLIVGMTIATFVNSTYYLIINAPYSVLITLDSFSHASMVLFIIYLMKSKQIEVEKKACLKSSLIMVGILIVIMIINLICKTAFFGLSFYGEHNIYHMLNLNSPVLSFMIYFIGLASVMFISYLVNKKLFVKENIQ